MKKRILCAAAAATAICLPFSVWACTPGEAEPELPAFVNPGDSLSGGGTGTVPTATDNTAAEANIAQAGTVDLSGLSADTDKTGATALSGKKITESGSYIVTGTFDGGIKISTGLTVHLFLENADISNSSGIAIESDKKCTVTITAIGANTVSNTAADKNAIHIKGSLAVNGSGSLSVTSAEKHAIKATKSLDIADATVTATAPNGHGITAQQIAANGAKITVNAGKDGLQAECDYDEPKNVDDCVFTLETGFVSLVNTDYTATTKGDGIQADTFVYIDGGTYSITTEGVFVSKTTQNMTDYGLAADDFRYVKSGSSYKKVASDYRGSGTLYALTQGCKGIKVGLIEFDSDGDGDDDMTVTADTAYSVMVKSGTLGFTTSDDCIHANGGDIIINGGNITLSTFDDGITADGLLKVSGGKINATACYEGLEGARIEISGGEITVNAEDDGINAAGTDKNTPAHIVISGGKVTVDSVGDGIDSNGSILISGGEVNVFGPTSGMDAGLDADTGVIVNGGTLFATASLGMVETPSKNSTQYVLSFATQSTIAAGTVITVADENGDELYSATLEKACQSLIISLPDFELNGKYKIYGGDAVLDEFTVTDIITVRGSSAQPGQGSFPGGRPGKR